METSTAIPAGQDTASIRAALLRMVAREETPDHEPLYLDLAFPPVDHYLCLGDLGSGGQSVVYKVADIRTAKAFAFKLQREKTPSSDYLFREEHRNLSKLANAGAPHPYDLNQHNGQFYLVMEYIPGQSLVKREPEATLVQRVDSGKELLCGIAQKMDLVHRAGYVHCDIKAGNVIVSDAGPRLIDFGMTCPIGTQSDAIVPCAKGTVLGTPATMAPEQISTEGILLPQADIYAFGLIAHQLLTGKPLRKLGPLSHVATLCTILAGDGRCGYERPLDLPRPLIDMIEMCTNTKPQNRYNNMEEVIAQLKA